MNKQEAVEFLVKYAIKSHRLNYTPSSRDFPSCIDMQTSCSRYRQTAMCEAVLDDDRPCNCGAESVNLLIQKAKEILLNE